MAGRYCPVRQSALHRDPLGSDYRKRVPIPEFIVELRRKIGHDLLWMPGVTAVVLRGEPGSEQVLLVKRSDNGWWTPVTGIVDPGEQPHLAAEREVLEEASVVAEVERLVWVQAGQPVTHANCDRSQYLDLTFRCRWVSGDPKPGDDEADDAAWFGMGELPELRDWHRARIDCALANSADVRLG